MNPSAPQKSSTAKKAKLILPWEIHSFFAEQVPEPAKQLLLPIDTEKTDETSEEDDEG